MDLFEEKRVSPMLIAQMQEPFNDDKWIYELKLDGCRCIGYFDQTGTCLRNKRNMEPLPRFPELKDLHRSVSERTVLDGELVVLLNGVPDFFELQRRTLLTDRFKIEMAAARHPASFVAYDCLYEGSRSIMDQPLLARKEALQSSVRENSLIAISRFIPTDGIGLFRAADEKELEGVVAKRAASLYYPGKRTKDWIKFKRMADEEFVVCGYIRKNSRTFSMILGKYHNGAYLYKGHVTLGVTKAAISQLKESSTMPFTAIPAGAGNENAVWVYPDQVCTVEYMPNTKNSLRQAVFKGFRTDMVPEDID
ncbi:MAG: DNA ligase [Lachnospiraceae bacterium]|nr:DNA ligase [Lachnospiraceae bacterium]